MSWYDDNFQRRAAISVPNTAGAASADVDVTIPAEWDEFWDAIDSSGNELRVTLSDGVTLVSYDVDKPGGGAFSKSGRSGRIRIDGVTLRATANTTALLWVYFDTETTVGDGSSAVTMSSILDGYIELGRPVDRRTVVQPHPPGLTRPQGIVSKDSLETQHYWVDFAAILQVYRTPSQLHSCYEELEAVELLVVDDTGSAANTLEDHTGTRFVEIVRGRERRMYARVTVTGGTSGERYTIGLRATTRTPASTSVHRTVTHRTGLVVIDAVEPAG